MKVQSVIGEMYTENILYYDIPTLWSITKELPGISESYFYEYFKDLEKGYAIIIDRFIKKEEK